MRCLELRFPTRRRERAAGASGAGQAARLFVLVREEDVSGVSGTGVIADGVVFGDGLAVLHWRGRVRSTAIYPSLESLLEIHGHDGRTRIKWVGATYQEVR